jgi:hypothetical protein
MTSKAVRAGGDFGNSQSTLTIPHGRGARAITIPSFIGSGRLVELQRMRGGRGGESQLKPDEHVLSYANVEQFVGELALTQTTDTTAARGDITRYWSGHTLRLLLTLAAIAWERRAPPLYLTTGLPVEVWSEENEELVRRALVGEHRYRFNGQERALEIQGVFVMMEGAGALARLGTDQEIPQAVIDVGGGSTDLYYAIGQEPQLPRCGGRPIGVERIGDLLADEFEATHGRRLTPAEVRGQLLAYARRMTPPQVFVDRRPVVINGEIRAADDAVGREIDQFVSRKWASGNRGEVAQEVAQVYLIGGGAYFPEVRRHIRELVGRVEVSERPEDENALGYWDVGNQITDADWAELG